MSELWHEGFKRRGWSLNDDRQRIFVVGASLDTFVRRDLMTLGEKYAAGDDLAFLVGKLFERFTWFIGLPERSPNIKDRHANYMFLVDVVDWYVTNELGIDNLAIHFDGDVTWV